MVFLCSVTNSTRRSYPGRTVLSYGLAYVCSHMPCFRRLLASTWCERRGANYLFLSKCLISLEKKSRRGVLKNLYCLLSWFVLNNSNYLDLILIINLRGVT
jgi:hypothetical protein